MRVLIADALSTRVVADLEALKCTVRTAPELGAENLPAQIGDAEVLIVRSTRVTADAIEAGADLSLVVRAGAGVNTIDLEAASAQGVYVASCPGKNADAVAELAIGLLIAADRRIVDATACLRRGEWKKAAFGQAKGLKGRTLGILGFGTVGRAVARRARGLEMDVLAYSRSLTPEAAARQGVTFAATPLEVAQAADAVSIHLAATPDTERLVGRDFLAAMKPGAVLVNTARGEIVDTAALKQAIDDKGLRVGLDVVEDEPAGGEARFADTDLAARLTATPHIGASTDQAREAIAAETVRVVRTFLATGTPANAVNVSARTPATHTLVVRHYDRVGVLAEVLSALREDGINIQEVRNTVFEGARAACCTLHLDDEPSAEALARIRANADVLHLTLQTR